MCSEGVVDFFGKMAKEQGVSHAQMEKDFIAQHRPTSMIRRRINPISGLSSRWIASLRSQ
jgi:hypothetical protein